MDNVSDTLGWVGGVVTVYGPISVAIVITLCASALTLRGVSRRIATTRIR